MEKEKKLKCFSEGGDILEGEKRLCNLLNQLSDYQERGRGQWGVRIENPSWEHRRSYRDSNNSCCVLSVGNIETDNKGGYLFKTRKRFFYEGNWDTFIEAVSSMDIDIDKGLEGYTPGEIERRTDVPSWWMDWRRREMITHRILGNGIINNGRVRQESYWADCPFSEDVLNGDSQNGR